MKLRMTSELRFPMGAAIPLSEESLDDLLVLISKISGAQTRKHTVEIFKRHFCNASGATYSPSSNLDWAESDMKSWAKKAAKDAPLFIAAIYDALDDLSQIDAILPPIHHINQILRKNLDPYEIIDGDLIQTGLGVSAPEPSESLSSTVMRALGDAKALIGTVDSSSAIDRAHTALHGYLIQLCIDIQVEQSSDLTASKAFKLLRKHHPALQPSGHKSEEVTRVLNSFAASIDAFSTLRNNASLAHVNELLDIPEATAIVNAMFTVFTYIQDCMRRAIG